MSDSMQTREQKVADRFKRETAEHVMTVRHDDGLYRHLRFQHPEHSFYWFDLITWPCCLTFRGSVGDYTFSRMADMFEFFRSYRSGDINPQYWAEKLCGGADRAMAYSQDLFNGMVADDLRESEADWPGVTKAWDEYINGYLAEYNTEHEADAREALKCFEYLPDGASGEPFRFQDSWEWQFDDFHWTFLWACHAVVWGISQYDAKKAGEAAVEVHPGQTEIPSGGAQ